jgi:hypothetical protein
VHKLKCWQCYLNSLISNRLKGPLPGIYISKSFTISQTSLLGFQNQFTQMTAVANMPGRWPKESQDNEGDIIDSLSGPRINTQMGELSLQIPAMSSTTSSQTSRDELFFDCPSPAQVPPLGQNGESSSPSYLIFEPVVESVSEDEPTDWWRYEPPRELLDIQDGTSTDIQGLIEPSIERIRARRVEEEERRISAARHERPIARVGRASVKPRREVSTLWFKNLFMLTSKSGFN